MRMEKSQSFNKRYFYNTSSCHGWVFPANHSYHLQLRKTPPWRGPVLGSCMVIPCRPGELRRLHWRLAASLVRPGWWSPGGTRWVFGRVVRLVFFSPVCTRDQKTCLVGGFNPSEKYESNWKSSPNRGEHEKKMSCHHLDVVDLPPGAQGFLLQIVNATLKQTNCVFQDGNVVKWIIYIHSPGVCK